MSNEAIIMMVIALTVIWGGFVLAVLKLPKD